MHVYLKFNAHQSKMAIASTEVATEWVVRGHHIYKKICTPLSNTVPPEVIKAANKAVEQASNKAGMAQQ